MSADIIDYPGETVLPTSCVSVLDGAKDADLASVVVIGRRSDNSLYLAGSHSELGEICLLLEIAKRKIVEMAQ